MTHFSSTDGIYPQADEAILFLELLQCRLKVVSLVAIQCSGLIHRCAWPTRNNIVLTGSLVSLCQLA